MADQRVELGPALGGEDGGHGQGINGRTRQTIDGFRRYQDQSPSPQGLRSSDYFAVAVTCTETFTLAGI